jgi:thioredoxin-related protein
MKKKYSGRERRKFLRFIHTIPLAYKVCRRETVSNLLKGYTSNISQSGLLCKIKEGVKKGDILWLAFERNTLSFCENLEKKVLIYQNGILGKVVWVKHKSKGSYDVGIQFITREEKNLTHIYPKIHFVELES